MQIRPLDKDSFDKNKTANIKKIHKDCYKILATSPLDENQWVLSIKYLVDDFPYKGITTFVKFLYYFSELANASEQDPNNPYLRLNFAVSSGYNGIHKIPIYIANGKSYGTTGITPYISSQQEIAPYFINIPEPDDIDIIAVPQNREVERHDITQFTWLYQLNSLIDRSFNCKEYKSSFVKNNTFTEENLISIAANYKSIPGKPNYAMDLVLKKQGVERILCNLLKSNLFSVMDGATLIYDNGKINIPEFTNPFGKTIVVPYLNEKLQALSHDLEWQAMKVEDEFGPIRLLIHLNDVEHVCQCTFYSDVHGINYNIFKSNRKITVHETKDKIFTDYLINSFTRFGSIVRQFSPENQKALDILTYM